jgi:hypothetical protein
MLIIKKSLLLVIANPEGAWQSHVFISAESLDKDT